MADIQISHNRSMFTSLTARWHDLVSRLNPFQRLATRRQVRELSLQLFNTQELLMAGQDAAVTALDTVNQTLDKISNESQALLVEIQALKDAAANGDQVSPELQAAIDRVVEKANAIDALVPDASTGPTDGGEGGGQDDDTVR